MGGVSVDQIGADISNRRQIFPSRMRSRVSVDQIGADISNL
jgi:hypothetical protein